MKKEVWKDVVGYEGCYKVSNLGRVKSLPRYATSSKPPRLGQKVTGGIMVQHAYPNGYVGVQISKNGTVKRMQVHRLVATAFHSNPHNKPDVHHKNKNRKDNKAKNLQWVTKKENMSYSKPTFTPEGIERLRKAAIELRKTNPRFGGTYQKVKIINKVTGEIFESGRELSRHLNIGYSTLMMRIYSQKTDYIKYTNS